MAPDSCSFAILRHEDSGYLEIRYIVNESALKAIQSGTDRMSGLGQKLTFKPILAHWQLWGG